MSVSQTTQPNAINKHIHKYLQQDHSSETECFSSQEIQYVTWNSNFHYHVHKSPRLVSLPRQIYPFHAFPTDLTSTLILSSNVGIGFTSGLFHPSFPTKPM